MEFFGIMAFILVLSYSDYPSKTKSLARELKRLKRGIKGENAMSVLLSGLVGKDCEIQMVEDAISFTNTNLDCTILDVDDEWVKIRLRDKTNRLIEKLIRVENIESIELLN